MSAAQATGFYRFEAKIISRGGGRSLVASAAYRTGGKSAASAAAYRAGVQLTDERTGISYDYTKKRGVIGAEIMLPNGAPSWMRDRATLWNAVEAAEKRKDAQTARDYLLSLPHQLSPEQRRALTKWFVAEQFTAKGYVADIAWHSPDSREGLNHHAHVMVTLRKVEGDGFARTKDRAPPGVHPMKAWKDDLMRLREAWAHAANRFLEAAGLDIRITHESLKSRGIDAEPDPKLGPIAMQMERAGRESHAGRDRREAAARNAERAELKSELARAAATEAQILDLVAQRLRRSEMKPGPLTDEELRLQHVEEAEALQALQAQDERLRAFKQKQAREAEEAGRQEERSERDEGRRRSDGEIANAAARYSLALADHYDIRDPYGSLARASMAEYGAFVKGQEQLRQQIAAEQNPEKRRLIELRQAIEGYDYMAVTSERIAGLHSTLAGREDAPRAILQYARGEAYAERASQLRKERGDLLVALEPEGLVQPDRAQPSDRQASTVKGHDEAAAGRKNETPDVVQTTRADASQSPGKPATPIRDEPPNTRDEANDGTQGRAIAPESDAELSDEKRAKLDRLNATRAVYAAHNEQKAKDRDRGGGRSGR